MTPTERITAIAVIPLWLTSAAGWAAWMVVLSPFARRAVR